MLQVLYCEIPAFIKRFTSPNKMRLESLTTDTCVQAVHEMHKILSQVEILGSPIMLGSSIITGLSAFLKAPAKARNPSEFARGLGTGSVILVKMASFGILTFIAQVHAVPLPLCHAVCV